MSDPELARLLLARLVDVERRLKAVEDAPLPGQEAIDVATIADHRYSGPGPCRDSLFGRECGAHRDAHHHTGD